MTMRWRTCDMYATSFRYSGYWLFCKCRFREVLCLYTVLSFVDYVKTGKLPINN